MALFFWPPGNGRDELAASRADTGRIRMTIGTTESGETRGATQSRPRKAGLGASMALSTAHYRPAADGTGSQPGKAGGITQLEQRRPGDSDGPDAKTAPPMPKALLIS